MFRLEAAGSVNHTVKYLEVHVCFKNSTSASVRSMQSIAMILLKGLADSFFTGIKTQLN